MSELANIADPAYADLEPITKGGPMLALMGVNIGIESSTARAPYIAWLQQSSNLYLFGREDGKIGDDRTTVNRILGTLNTFTAMATRTDPAIIIKSVSANEDGKWYLKKPFSLPPQNGQGQPIPLPYLEKNPETGKIVPLDDAIVDHVPPDYRVCVDTETCVAWAQKNFDILARECRMFDLVRQMIHWKQQYGWVMGHYQWDAVTENSVIRLHEPQQWLPDDLVEDVSDMNFVRLDVPTDANQAKRQHPEMAAYIDANATRSVVLQGGNTATASKYLVTNYARPMIVLCYCWLRNQDAPMTMQEGLDTGMLAWKGPDDEAPEAETAGAEGDSSGGASMDEGVENGDESAGNGGDETQSPQGDDGGGEQDAGGVEQGQGGDGVHSPRLIHTPTGDDVTSSFNLDDGQPAPHPDTGELHPNHPHKIVIRQWIQFNDQVIPGSDKVCPHWDIPVFSDRNIPIIGKPWGRPETERLASPQRVLNNTETAMVDHVAFFRAPGGFMYKDIQSKISPKFSKDGFMEPGKWYTIESDGAQDFDITKKIFNLPPPQMPPAIPQLKTDAGKDFELIAGNPGVDNGVAPTKDASGRLVEALQSSSQASQGFKTMFSEGAIWRISKLKLNAEVNWMSMKKIAKINRSIPLPLVEDAVLPFLRNMLLDVDVAMPTGSGQVKVQKDNQIRQDFSAKLIDQETALDELDYDSTEVFRRFKNQRMEVQEEQQANAGPPKPPESISLSVNYQNLPVEAQNAALKIMGLPATAQPMALPSQNVQPKPLAIAGSE